MKKLLVAYDGSEPSRHAATRAAEIAAAMQSQVTVVLVVEMVESGYGAMVPVADEAAYQKTLDAGVAAIAAAGVPVEGRLAWGTSGEKPAELIEAIARTEHFDLVVMGHRGLTGLKELFLGSVAKHVIDHVPCSVLIVR